MGVGGNEIILKTASKKPGESVYTGGRVRRGGSGLLDPSHSQHWCDEARRYPRRGQSRSEGMMQCKLGRNQSQGKLFMKEQPYPQID
jgi:hypothetical protein